MPRKKTVATGPTESKDPRRSSRRIAKEGGIPEIYQDMLVEAAASAPLMANDEGRAAKRRRVVEPLPYHITPEPQLSSSEKPEDDIEPEAGSVPPIGARQTIYDDFVDSDESDADFEDVVLKHGPEASDGEVESDKPLQLDLSWPSGRQHTPPVQRRKPATTAEKRLRLHVHKWHVLCLLLHGCHRNRWCDNGEVQEILKPLIPRKLISLLHLDESKPQHSRNHGFNKAMEEINDIWRREWTITAKGLRRAFWAEDADVSRDIDDLEDPVDLNDFKEAAKSMSGSRDLGAQLFCALLRSVAVDTRLVFSLQPLPFSGVAKGAAPETAKPQYIYASSTTNQLPYQASSAENIASPSSPRWRASECAAEEQFPHPPLPRAPSSKSPIKDSPYPIFWVEVFSPSIDKWIPVDPLVRHTFNKPRTGYEPPASDRMNSMSYVIAFQDDGSARDVTRRYASQYNAKTRKLRVESTKGGEKWWKQTMEFFERPFPETRDEIEVNELAAREAQEGMPKNLGDFKGHPIFALERHLRRNEVIYPLREAGKISTGPGGKVEPVYRRRDVHVVRSADQWYRKGRDVREGEQPLKQAIVRRSKRDTPMGEDEVDDYGAGLYAEFQTDVYVPPPVVNRRIPKNAYGNLDVYVPSMIPAGAIHLQHPLAARAAKVMGMDYADAVTGFDFKGRQGTAVVNGIIAAQESREALIEVIKRMEQEQAEAEQEKRTNLALQMWKKFMTALRIRDKIDKEYADAGSDEDMADLTYDGNDSGDGGAGGGFVPDADMNEEGIVSFASQSPLRPASVPFVPSEIIIVESPHRLEKPGLEIMQQKLNSLDSLFEEPDSQGNDGGSPTGEISNEQPGGFMVEEGVDGEGGGFVPEEDDDQGGGFILNETDDAQGSGMLPEGPRREPCTATPAPGLQVAVGGDSVPAPRPDPPGESVSLLDAVEKSDSKALPDSQEKPSALVDERSALTPKDIGSTGSSDSLDNESLLSHDPEDEDAEPEWLLDAEGP